MEEPRGEPVWVATMFVLLPARHGLLQIGGHAPRRAKRCAPANAIMWWQNGIGLRRRSRGLLGAGRWGQAGGACRSIIARQAGASGPSQGAACPQYSLCSGSEHRSCPACRHAVRRDQFGRHRPSRNAPFGNVTISPSIGDNKTFLQA
jgi:hypothetical protein